MYAMAPWWMNLRDLIIGDLIFAREMRRHPWHYTVDLDWFGRVKAVFDADGHGPLRIGRTRFGLIIRVGGFCRDARCVDGHIPWPVD